MKDTDNCGKFEVDGKIWMYYLLWTSWRKYDCPKDDYYKRQQPSPLPLIWERSPRLRQSVFLLNSCTVSCLPPLTPSHNSVPYYQSAWALPKSAWNPKEVKRRTVKDPNILPDIPHRTVFLIVPTSLSLPIRLQWQKQACSLLHIFLVFWLLDINESSGL